jgi:hypothetical protein
MTPALIRGRFMKKEKSEAYNPEVCPFKNAAKAFRQIRKFLPQLKLTMSAVQYIE